MIALAEAAVAILGDGERREPGRVVIRCCQSLTEHENRTCEIVELRHRNDASTIRRLVAAEARKAGCRLGLLQR